MTSIRDISNNLIRLHEDYTKSSHEMKQLLNEYNCTSDKRLNYNDHSIAVFQLSIQYINARDLTTDLQRKYHYANYLNGSHIQSVKLSAKKITSMHPETCGICMEHHTYSKMITTSCRHHFGKQCLSKWIETCFVNYQDVSCGLCRDTNFTVTRYVAKKK